MPKKIKKATKKQEKLISCELKLYAYSSAMYYALLTAAPKKRIKLIQSKIKQIKAEIKNI